jgi:hypothetical protein
MDAIEATGYTNPSEVWDRLKRDHPRLETFVSNFQFPGRGQRPTPVTDRTGVLQILAVTHGPAGEKIRDELIDKYIRYLDGDVSMIEEMIDRQEDPETLKRLEIRIKTKQSQKQLVTTIEDHGGRKEGRFNIFAVVNDTNNMAVYGHRARAVQAAGGNPTTRDNLNVEPVHLAFLHLTEELETHRIKNENLHGNVQIMDAVGHVCTDIIEMRQRHGVPDVVI